MKHIFKHFVGCFFDVIDDDVGVPFSCADIRLAKHDLDGSQVGFVLQHVRGDAVSQ